MFSIDSYLDTNILIGSFHASNGIFGDEKLCVGRDLFTPKSLIIDRKSVRFEV